MFTVNFSGIKDEPSYLADSLQRGIDEDKVVKISTNLTVALCDEEDNFRGVVVTIDHGNEVCAVKERGYVTLPYTGSAPSVGEAVELVANGDGGVKTPASPDTGKRYPVVDVDTEANTVTFKLLG
ncbi:MAG: hypothetical protein JXK07_10030 [Spirochaetes bacterium]|nr:hypothetical protein [Spirochaetota bacterium]MBN2771264.1 hypothetical protein [Spirochaetota bacterium]